MVMRDVNRGELVAQCNLASSTKPIEKPVELADYQNDVQQALGKMFGRFERAGENTTPSGLRLLKAIVAGKADDITVQWRYYLVHDQQGRVLSIVYTMETPFVDQFGDDDQPIINSVQFMEPKLAALKRRPANRLSTQFASLAPAPPGDRIAGCHCWLVQQ